MIRIGAGQKIWFDLSTCSTLASRTPVGLSRLELNVLRAALAMPKDQVRFCCRLGPPNIFGEVKRQDVIELVDDFGNVADRSETAPLEPHVPITPPRGGAAREFFRKVERTIRRMRRGQRAVKWQSTTALKLATETPIDPGDYLFISGAVWHHVPVDDLRKWLVANRIKLIAILADMIPAIFPHFYQERPSSEEFLDYARLLAKHAEAVLSISDSCTEDFLKVAAETGVQPRTHQVMIGSDLHNPQLQKPGGKASGLRPREFVLTVSTVQVRKNHRLLYYLWRRMRENGRDRIPTLVVCGSQGRLCDDLIYQMQHDPLIKDRLLLLHKMTDGELAWLYQNCAFTVYPSFYEGWGLPIVESLEYGKACIASNTSSMPQASQGLALHLDPLDFRAWYDTLCQWIDDPQQVRDAEARIRNQYRRQTWADFRREVSAVFSFEHQDQQRRAA